jgi:hypothetical protein
MGGHTGLMAFLASAPVRSFHGSVHLKLLIAALLLPPWGPCELPTPIHL